MKWNGVSWEMLGTPAVNGYSSYALFDPGGGLQLFRSAGDGPSFRGELTRYTGSSWQTILVNPDPNPGFVVIAMETFDDGNGEQLYIGGDFMDFEGAPETFGIARWDGSAWTSVGGGITDLNTFPDDYVSVLQVIDLGAGPGLYAGGHFQHMGGTSTNYVAKWNGQEWESFGESLQGDFGIRALAGFDDGSGPALYAAQSRTYLVDGRSNTAKNPYPYQVFKWVEPDWNPLGTGFDNEIESLISFDDGSGPALYAGGDFFTVDGLSSMYLAKYTCSPKTDLAVSLTDGVSTTTSGETLVYTLVVRNVGDIEEPTASLENILPQDSTCSFTSSAAGGAGGNSPAGFGSLSETLVLPVGGTVTYQVECTVPAVSNHPLVHSVTVSGSQPDSDLADNTATDIDLIQPLLSVPDLLTVAPDQPFDYTISLRTGGQGISALAFSIDYDEGCLDPSDAGGNLAFFEANVPSDWTSTVRFDPGDTDGEIDISAFDWTPPISTLTGEETFSLRFSPTCTSSSVSVDVPIVFSSSPAPSFSNELAQAIPGTWNSGYVRILAGPRGDCNSDSVVAASDLVAVGLEIFDGDGEDWLEAVNPAYPGKPVGCDANGSTQINAADVVCTNLLIFGEPCGSSANLSTASPRLEISTIFDGSVNWIQATLVPNGSAVGSLAYSLDLDPVRFDLSQVDTNSDGVPDLLRFPAGLPNLAQIAFSAADSDGELDILIADLAQRALPGGILVEVGVPAAFAAKRGFRIAVEPSPSFGSVEGADLDGEIMEGALLFRDGFETGDTGQWALSLPLNESLHERNER